METSYRLLPPFLFVSKLNNDDGGGGGGGELEKDWM